MQRFRHLINHDESEGISIVITSQKNNGITNDGDSHVTEYYYEAIKLRRADSKPLVEILKSVKQSLYSGEYKDTTGLAEIQEVNGIRFSIKEVNDRFNAEHQQQIDGTLPKGHMAVIQGVENCSIAESNGVLLICKREEEQQIRQFHMDAEDKWK